MISLLKKLKERERKKNFKKKKTEKKIKIKRKIKRLCDGNCQKERVRWRL